MPGKHPLSPATISHIHCYSFKKTLLCVVSGAQHNTESGRAESLGYRAFDNAGKPLAAAYRKGEPRGKPRFVEMIFEGECCLPVI